jgi:drug/metabolite transporter (DMT)-like permease
VIKIIFYTAFALCAFAFNSILCRMALRGGEADAAGFTAVRLVSGAVTLIVISYLFGKGKSVSGGNFISAFFLFGYAICFSLAYLGLSAGTGGLILFGCVQLTMILVALFRGERPGVLEWVGLIAAIGGLVYLVLPGLSAPPLHSAGLMAAAGVAWGIYTLRGKSAGDPLGSTTGNFIWSVPMIVLAAIPYFSQLHLSTRGVLLAILSGAVASGVGYTAWYAALKHLSSTRAAVLQLSVPILVAAGGIAFLGEAATTRLWIAAALILGGVGLTVAAKGR